MGCDVDDVPKADKTDFYEYIKDFQESCDGDEDCLKAGSRWSHVFLANGILMAVIALNMVCVAVGAYKATIRTVAAYFAVCIYCAHFGTIVATGVYRFRPIGMACAMSEKATNAPTENVVDINDDWTYKKDGTLLLALFIVQLVTCQGCCIAAVFPLRSS